MRKKPFFLLISLALLFCVCSGIPGYAASKAEIDANVDEALATFYKKTSAGKKLASKAA